jgi:hypothetical protein
VRHQDRPLPVWRLQGTPYSFIRTLSMAFSDTVTWKSRKDRKRELERASGEGGKGAEENVHVFQQHTCIVIQDSLTRGAPSCS